MAEGTIGSDGKPTGAWYQHGDPGNGKLNKGFGSYQVYQDPRGASLTPQQADRLQADRLAAQWSSLEVALNKAGIAPGQARNLIAANALDAWNQAPAVFGGSFGLLNQRRLSELKASIDGGESPLDAVTQWRANSYREDNGRLNAPGLGNDFGRVTADQRRRAEAVARGLSLRNTASSSGEPAMSAPAPTNDPAPVEPTLSPSLVLRSGSAGDDVRQLQRALNQAGASPRLDEDGVFGARTEAAVSTYQRQRGLMVDGIAGAETIGALTKNSSAGTPGVADSTTLDALGKARSGEGDVPVFAGTAPSTTSVRHPWMDKLATSHLNDGRTGFCVETTLGNMDRLGIPSFQGGTTGDRNNPRGAMVQMINGGHWKSLPLEGSKPRTIKSPYGTVRAHVLNADAYERMAMAGKIPSGAILFQTRHGWDYGGGSLGNDMGIVRDGGRVTHNYRSMPPIIYGDAKEVVVLVPR